MNRFIHDRGVRLAAGLAVVVAIPMAVLFYFQFKSLNDIETTSAVVLRQLSSETADSLTRSVEDYMKRPHISVLLRITQGRTEPLDLPFIEPILNDALAESPFVESFFFWTEVGPQANKWLVFDEASKALPSGARSGSAKTRWSAIELLRRLRELVKTKRAIVAFTETINGRPHYVQAQLRWEGPARERMTSVIAFAVDAEKLRTKYIPQLLRDWLASVQQPSGFPHLETEVLDENGEHIYASHPERTRPCDAGRRAQLRDHLLRQGAARIRGAVRAASRDVGRCGPATGRSRFMKSSAPARGRSSP